MYIKNYKKYIIKKYINLIRSYIHIFYFLNTSQKH